MGVKVHSLGFMTFGANNGCFSACRYYAVLLLSKSSSGGGLEMLVVLAGLVELHVCSSSKTNACSC